VRAVEGPIATVQCVTAPLGCQSTCHRAEGCTTRLVWTRLSEVIAQFLDAITLKELCDQTRQLKPVSAFGHYHAVETPAEAAGQSSHREASLLAVSAYTYEI